MSSLIEIVCDGGPQNGCGHLRRSLALANELQKRQHRVRLSPLSDSGRALLKKNHPLDVPGRADLVLFDLPDTIDSPIQRACQGEVPTIALDYFGSAQPTLTISVRERRADLLGQRKSGLEYAIVRKEILVQSPKIPGRGVLVMMGGADVRGLSESIAIELAELGEEVTVVVGPFATMPESAGNVRIFRDPDCLPELMASARWAVSSGGVSMIELMSLGRPVHVVAQTDPETRLATLLYRQGGLLGIGTDSIGMYSAQKIEQVSTRAMELVDGRGAERIAQDIEALL